MSEYQQKFERIAPWIETLFDSVKKDLKNEHLQKDRNFCKRYFLGKNFNLVTAAEMAPAYQKEIAEGNVALGEFITSRWLLKNSDVYDFFEQELSKINPDFEAIIHLDEESAKNLIESALALFGAVRTYLFAILNSVTFPDHCFESLRERALCEESEESQKLAVKKEEESLEAMQKRHDREMSALHNKYDKKFSGIQKKYIKDTGGLKKQISTLTKKLAEHG